jgi:hypothetical protein
LRDNHATTIMPMPRHRIPILIAAPFPSRSPRYTRFPEVTDRGLNIYHALNVMPHFMIWLHKGLLANASLSGLSA